MIHHAAMDLMPTRGRLLSILTAWQEMRSGLYGGELDVTRLGGDSLFHNTWGNIPMWTDLKNTLKWASQNVRSIIPKDKDPKLAAGIYNLIKLETWIVGLTVTNAEWNCYAYQ
jgi:hypothetical protein